MTKLLPGGIRQRLGGLGVVVVAVGWLMARMPAETPGRVWWPWLVLAGAALTTVVVLSWWNARASSAGRVEKWTAHAQKHDGVARTWTILRHASRFAVRRKAKVMRPSIAGLSLWARLRLPTREVATAVARVGVVRIWSAIEDVTLRVGGPRVGKTGELACRILDASGAVIATSTRTDLIDHTQRCRTDKGPTHVFNPSGVGSLPSTITFDPLAGCTEPKTATERAADLIAGVTAPGTTTGGDREYWAGQARRVLACLLHAAALSGASMRDVHAWVADPDTHAAAVRRALRRSSESSWEADALQFLTLNDRTRTSISSTVMPALNWLADPTAAAAATGGGFDVAELLAQRGTVYMLGAEDAQVAPLVTALTGHIAREARRIAGAQPGGRLDPPLTLALDEAALICPIPLDNWTADMGGRGVTIHIAVQSRAQLRQRWGDAGAASIVNNAATLLIFGGTKDTDDLASWSTLTGERLEEVPTYDPDGKLTAVSTRRVPVLTAAQISQLPKGNVVVIHRGMPPAVGTTPMVWDRRDYKAAERAAKWAERRTACAAAWAQACELTRAGWATARSWAAPRLAAAWAWALPRLAAGWAWFVGLGERIDDGLDATAERIDAYNRNLRARQAARRDTGGDVR